MGTRRFRLLLNAYPAEIKKRSSKLDVGKIDLQLIHAMVGIDSLFFIIQKVVTDTQTVRVQKADFAQSGRLVSDSSSYFVMNLSKIIWA